MSEQQTMAKHREDLLTIKDRTRREHRSLQDRCCDARKELEQVEAELRDLEKEEIKALKDRWHEQGEALEKAIPTV